MNRPCPLCKSTESGFLWNITRFERPFEIHRCTRCGLIMMKPLPEMASPEEMYGEAYYTGPGDRGQYTYLDERRNPRGHRAVNRARIRFLLRLYRKLQAKTGSNPATPVFLDVGCSFGALVHEARLAGCDAHGIDISGFAAAEGARTGLDIRKATAETLPDYGTPLDLVTMIEVIEHLADPAKALRALARAMRPGGLLVIQTADMDGRQAQKAGPGYHYFLPGHLVYFSQQTLTRLLDLCGFDVVRVSRPCEFGLWPKLIKSRGTFRSFREYRKWLTIAWYHLKSKLRWRGTPLTSGMVVHARRRCDE